jgi:hypothetical protein
MIHFSYKVIFSQAIKQTAFNSELGTLPVTFHMELRKESILPDADMQCTSFILLISVPVTFDSDMQVPE